MRPRQFRQQGATVAIGHHDDAAAASGLHCRAHRCECKHDACSIPGREGEERKQGCSSLFAPRPARGPKLDCARVSFWPQTRVRTCLFLLNPLHVCLGVGLISLCRLLACWPWRPSMLYARSPQPQKPPLRSCSAQTCGAEPGLAGRHQHPLARLLPWAPLPSGKTAGTWAIALAQILKSQTLVLI